MKQLQQSRNSASTLAIFATAKLFLTHQFRPFPGREGAAMQNRHTLRHDIAALLLQTCNCARALQVSIVKK